MKAGQLSAATAQNDVSTVNRVLEIARKNRALTVSPIRGAVRIVRGTKGGRARTVPVLRPEQVTVLERAAAVQDGRSLVPRDTRTTKPRGNRVVPMGYSRGSRGQ